MLKNSDNDILLEATEALKKHTGIIVIFTPVDKSEGLSLTIEIPDQRKKQEFTVEIVSNPATFIPGRSMKDTMRHLLVAPYVNPNLADRLRNMGAQFIDCEGNAYINNGAMYLLVKGNKRSDVAAKRASHHFNPNGLKVVFALLCNPGGVEATYRAIADRSGVALGTVASVLNDLKNQGYLINFAGKYRRLVKKKMLLDLWLVGYEQLLRPRLLVNKYHAERYDWWLNAKLTQEMWGGEVAAYQLTKYLKPEIVTLYTPKLAAPVLLENKLRLDPEGEIEVVEPFWNFDYPEKKENLVPPLLVYADLMIRADGRSVETARIIYERFFARHFNQD